MTGWFSSCSLIRELFVAYTGIINLMQSLKNKPWLFICQYSYLEFGNPNIDRLFTLHYHPNDKNWSTTVQPWQPSFVTARKRSLRRLYFYTCLSFCSQGRGVSRPRPRERLGVWLGGCLGLDPGWGSWQGVCVQVQAQSGVCIPAWTEADPPADGYCCGSYASYWNAFLLPMLMLAIRQISLVKQKTKAY